MTNAQYSLRGTMLAMLVLSVMGATGLMAQSRIGEAIASGWLTLFAIGAFYTATTTRLPRATAALLLLGGFVSTATVLLLVAVE